MMLTCFLVGAFVLAQVPHVILPPLRHAWFILDAIDVLDLPAPRTVLPHSVICYRNLQSWPIADVRQTEGHGYATMFALHSRPSTTEQSGRATESAEEERSGSNCGVGGGKSRQRRRQE
jgi:hypothetical protein